MPNWNRVMRNVVKVAGEVAKEANARQQAAQRQRTPPKSRATQVCSFWNCETLIRADHTLCYDHYQELQDGLIDACPGCGRGKYAQYGEWLECQDKAPARASRRQPAKRATSRRYEPERSDAWEANDAEANEFFAYILKLDGGKFYAGQTRELRERLSEHKDGQVRSTAGGNPKLVWFGIVSTR